jgi:hypothetical protein
MKELESPNKITSDVELVAKFQKEYTLKKREQVRRGLTYWEVDLLNMDATPVKIKKEVAIGLDQKPIKTNRAHYREDRVYVWALTKFHALRKATKELERFINNQKA